METQNMEDNENRPLFVERRKGYTTGIIEKTTLLGLVITMAFQIGVTVWWASRINTVQEYHSQWIIEHSQSQINYPVVESRVYDIESTVDKVMFKLDTYIDDLKECQAFNKGK